QSNDDDADQTGCRPPPRSASTRHKSMRAVALVGHFRFLPPSSAEHIVRFMTGADLSQRHPHTRAHYGTLIKTRKNCTDIVRHFLFLGSVQLCRQYSGDLLASATRRLPRLNSMVGLRVVTAQL